MSDIAFNLYVCDENNVVIDEIYSVHSLQWFEEYNGAGEIKLVCANTNANATLLKVGARLWLKERPHLIVILDAVTTKETNTQKTITARGTFSVNMWKNRMVQHNIQFDSANAEAEILNLLNANKRNLPCGIAAAKGFENTVSGSFKWENAFEIVSTLAKEANLGFYHNLNDDGDEVFTLYSGTDRTDVKSENYVGYFAVSAANISQLDILKSDTEYKNVAYVCGAGEEAERLVEKVDLSQGELAREMYVNADDIGPTYKIVNEDETYTTGTYTNEQQRQMLRARGEQALKQQMLTNTITADIAQKNILFGKHYELGDIMPLVIQNPHKQTIKARITGVKIIFETHKQINITLEVSL